MRTRVAPPPAGNNHHRDPKISCCLLAVLAGLILTFDPAEGFCQTVILKAPVHTAQKALDFDLSRVPNIDQASITIANHGDTPLVMPEVFAAGSPAMTRASILSWIQAQGPLTEEQFASAAWTFVSQHFWHLCSAGNPAVGEAFDPQRLLRGYGFACCNQVSRVLVWVWQGAGYPARIASMTNFHTVAEIYYQGAWHMYDPDHKVYYLARDNQTVADVATAKADPYLVARTADANGKDPVGYSAQWMADQYAVAEISYWTPHYTSDTQYTLRPAESFTLNSENLFSDVLYQRLATSFGRPAPYSVTSGQYDWALDFSQPTWNTYASSANGVTTLVSGQRVFLANTEAGSGYVVYQMSSAFPVFQLQVSGLFYRADSSATINVYFSTDGSQWSEAFPIASASHTAVQTSVDLSTVAQGADSYFVKLEFSGAAGAARVAALHITSNVQVAKILFPQLVPGAVNHLLYQDWGAALDRRNLEVTLALREFPATSRGTTVPLAVIPAAKTSGSTTWRVRTNGGFLKTGATFSWSRSSYHRRWWFGEQTSGVPWYLSWFIQNQPIPPAPVSVRFASPSNTFWVLSPTRPALTMVGQPPVAAVQAASSLPENPAFLPAYAATHLVDGDLNTPAYPGSNHLDYVVSLSGSAHVSTACITWGYFGMLPGYVRSWMLYGRNGSDSDWQPLAQGAFPHSITTGVELDEVVTDLRIVADGALWIGVFEFTVTGAPALSDLTASSNILELPEVPGYQPAAQVADGDDTTLAYIGSANSDYTVNLPPSTYVDAARIVWGSYGTNSAYIKHWQLYGLRKASKQWQVIARGGFPAAPETVVKVLDTYERVRIAAESDHAWIGIYELQVFGVFLDPPASALPADDRDRVALDQSAAKGLEGWEQRKQQPRAAGD